MGGRSPPPTGIDRDTGMESPHSAWKSNELPKSASGVNGPPAGPQPVAPGDRGDGGERAVRSERAVAGSTTARPAGTAADVDDVRVRVVDNILALAQLLKSALDSRLAETELNGVRSSVLGVIRRAAPHGCAQNELARALGQSESSVSALVDRMRSDRLIYRLRSKTDRRKRLLLLTDEGRQALDRAEQSRAEWAAGLFGSLDAGRLASLDSLLTRAVEPLTAESANPSIPVSQTPPRPRLKVS